MTVNGNCPTGGNYSGPVGVMSEALKRTVCVLKMACKAG